MRKPWIIAAGLSLMLVGCAQPPQTIPVDDTPAVTETVAEDFKACLVADRAGSELTDALSTAESELEVQIQIAEIESEEDYASSFQGLVDDGCDLVIGAGGNVASALQAAAENNPDTKFAIIDALTSRPLSNIRTVVSHVHEPSFLAGYIAAAQSETGTVGVFGGLNIASVTLYMDGFVQGVEHWNETQDAEVEVVGWDMEVQDGTFVLSTTDPFADPAAAQTAAEELISQGADVIFAVAGESNAGAIAAAQNSEGVRVMWSGSDGRSTSDSPDLILTSAYQDNDRTVVELIRSQRDSAASGVFVANLRNGGVTLGEISPEVADDVQAQISDLQTDVINGTIDVTSPSEIA